MGVGLKLLLLVCPAKTNTYLENAPELEGALVDNPVVVASPGVGVTALLHGFGCRRLVVLVLIIVVLETSPGVRCAVAGGFAMKLERRLFFY